MSSPTGTPLVPVLHVIPVAAALILPGLASGLVGGGGRIKADDAAAWASILWLGFLLVASRRHAAPLPPELTPAPPPARAARGAPALAPPPAQVIACCIARSTAWGRQQDSQAASKRSVVLHLGPQAASFLVHAHTRDQHGSSSSGGGVGGTDGSGDGAEAGQAPAAAAAYTLELSVPEGLAAHFAGAHAGGVSSGGGGGGQPPGDEGSGGDEAHGAADGSPGATTPALNATATTGDGAGTTSSSSSSGAAAGGSVGSWLGERLLPLWRRGCRSPPPSGGTHWGSASQHIAVVVQPDGCVHLASMTGEPGGDAMQQRGGGQDLEAAAGAAGRREAGRPDGPTLDIELAEAGRTRN